jgi:ParB-like chromosome segregation protein Spo0J
MTEILIEHLRIEEIKEHPLNRQIFNEISSDQHDALREYITKRGLVKPLIINTENFLLAGHARFQICKELKYETVPVQRVKFASAKEEEEYLILDNLLSRDISPIEQAKAGMHIETIKEKYQRTGKPLRDIVAKSLGLSSFQYQKAKAILQSGEPELIARVDRGETSVNRAYIMLKEIKRRRAEKKQAASEQPRFRLINEDPLGVLTNFKPDSIDTLIVEPPEGYNSIWVDLAKRALKHTGSLFILTQRNFAAIYEAFSSMHLVAPICVLGRTHQDNAIVFNHQMAVWFGKTSSYKSNEAQKVSTVWDFRSAPDVLRETYARMINLTTQPADVIVHLFGENQPMSPLARELDRHIFAVQPVDEKFYREKLKV